MKKLVLTICCVLVLVGSGCAITDAIGVFAPMTTSAGNPESGSPTMPDYSAGAATSLLVGAGLVQGCNEEQTSNLHAIEKFNQDSIQLCPFNPGSTVCAFQQDLRLR